MFFVLFLCFLCFPVFGWMFFCVLFVFFCVFVCVFCAAGKPTKTAKKHDAICDLCCQLTHLCYQLTHLYANSAAACSVFGGSQTLGSGPWAQAPCSLSNSPPPAPWPLALGLGSEPGPLYSSISSITIFRPGPSPGSAPGSLPRTRNLKKYKVQKRKNSPGI